MFIRVHTATGMYGCRQNAQSWQRVVSRLIITEGARANFRPIKPTRSEPLLTPNVIPPGSGDTIPLDIWKFGFSAVCNSRRVASRGKGVPRGSPFVLCLLEFDNSWLADDYDTPIWEIFKQGFGLFLHLHVSICGGL